MRDYILEDESGLLVDYIPAEKAVLEEVPYWFFEKTYELKVWNTLGNEGNNAYVGYWKTSLKNPEQPNIWVNTEYVKRLLGKYSHLNIEKYELETGGLTYILYQIQLR